MIQTQQTAQRPQLPADTQSVRLYSPSQHFSSIVSIPHRCTLWGDARYRGNCDGTLFKELVHQYKPRSIADPMNGSGTTADVVAGLRGLGLYDGSYWSSDLREGFNLLTTPLPGRHDMVWIHPPYWNIIRYSDHIADLSAIDVFEEFIVALEACLIRCIESLNPHGILAVLIGDVRRQGRYYCLAHHVMGMSDRLGSLVSVIIKAQHNCSSDRKRYGSMKHVPIKHEYCLLFQKSG